VTNKRPDLTYQLEFIKDQTSKHVEENMMDKTDITSIRVDLF
jgi:hypothetical protein